jgi:hypothetical protein
MIDAAGKFDVEAAVIDAAGVVRGAHRCAQ